jgi:hypothetical protein
LGVSIRWEAEKIQLRLTEESVFAFSDVIVDGTDRIPYFSLGTGWSKSLHPFLVSHLSHLSVHWILYLVVVTAFPSRHSFGTYALLQSFAPHLNYR